MQIVYWLIAIVLSAGAAFWVYRADKRRAVPYPWLTSLLRGLVVLFTALLVLAPDIHISNNVEEKPVVLLLQDNSRSISNALGGDSATYRKNMEALIGRLSAKYKVVQWGFGNTIQTDSPFLYTQGATDISSALTRAQEYYGLQNLGAVVLATDGRFNQGTNPMYQQLAIPGSLYTVAIGDSAQQKDIRITKAYANKSVAINSTFEVRADVVAELCNGYSNSVTIKEGNETLASSPVSISTNRYDRSVSFTLKAAKAGLHHYTISVPEAAGEKNVTNNRKDIFVDVVEEKKNVLIASSSPHPDVNAIRDALTVVGTYKVTIVTADNMPASFVDFDVLILHGLPSAKGRIAEQVLASKKPVWLILSAQTDMASLPLLAPLTHATVTPSAPHDVLPAFNTSFNTFILPKTVQSVTDKLPPLVSPVATLSAAPGANSLFTQRMGPQLPLWSIYQGSVPFAILAGEGLWRWRLYEYKNYNEHEVVDECIRQTVGFLAANLSEKPFNVRLPKYVWSDQEAISLSAYQLNANNEQVNTSDVQISITDSAGRKQNYSFERSGNAYSLNIGVWAGGTYTYNARTNYNGKDYTASGTFAVESTPLEFMQSGADYPLLYGIAKKYNGTLFPANNFGALYDSITRNERVKPLIHTNTETVPLVDKKWIFFLILIVAVAEWLMRKYWLAQ
jgi:hypothetical protein